MLDAARLCVIMPRRWKKSIGMDHRMREEASVPVSAGAGETRVPTEPTGLGAYILVLILALPLTFVQFWYMWQSGHEQALSAQRITISLTQEDLDTGDPRKIGAIITREYYLTQMGRAHGESEAQRRWEEYLGGLDEETRRFVEERYGKAGTAGQ